MKKFKLICIILSMMLTVSGCGLMPDNSDMEPHSHLSKKIPEPIDPDEN